MKIKIPLARLHLLVRPNQCRGEMGRLGGVPCPLIPGDMHPSDSWDFMYGKP